MRRRKYHIRLGKLLAFILVIIAVWSPGLCHRIHIPLCVNEI